MTDDDKAKIRAMIPDKELADQAIAGLDEAERSREILDRRVAKLALNAFRTGYREMTAILSSR